MKFLIDAQLPYLLRNWLCDKGHDAIHTRDLPRKNLTEDLEIMEVAEDQNRIVISKDSDFIKYYLITGKPKKLIAITTGNIINQELILLFENNFPALQELIAKHDFIEMDNDSIIAHD